MISVGRVGGAADLEALPPEVPDADERSGQIPTGRRSRRRLALVVASAVVVAAGGALLLAATRPAPLSGSGCSQHAAPISGAADPSLPELPPGAAEFRAVRGTLKGVSWQVLVGGDATSQTDELVIAGKAFGGATGANFADVGWTFDRAPSGDWVYGPVAQGVARVRAVLRGGDVLMACVVHVPAPLDESLFALGVPPGVGFDTVEALTGGGREVLQRADIAASFGARQATTLFVVSVTATKP
jgi:hypothetical protein